MKTRIYIKISACDSYEILRESKPRQIESNVTSRSEILAHSCPSSHIRTVRALQPFTNHAVVRPRFMRRRAAPRSAAQRLASPFKCSARKRTGRGVDIRHYRPMIYAFRVCVFHRSHLLSSKFITGARARAARFNTGRFAIVAVLPLQDAAAATAATPGAASRALSLPPSLFYPSARTAVLPFSCRFLFQRFSVYRLTTARYELLGADYNV